MKTQNNTSARYLLLTAAVAFWTITVGCSSAPAPTERDNSSGTAQGEVAERNQEIEELRAEVRRLEAELSSLEQAAAEAARKESDAEQTAREESRRDGADTPTENVDQLRRENDRLRDLVEELRLALTAVGVETSATGGTPVPPPEGGQAASAPEPTRRGGAAVAASPEEVTFRRVESVNPVLNDRTPPQLREQQVLRVPTIGGGYAYVDQRANSSDGQGLYLELHLLPDMQVPEARLRVTAVYPVEETPLRFSRFTLTEGDELFEFRISNIDRRRSGSLAAETLTAPMQPELRRLLVFLQRRPMAELLLTFHGTAGERSHRVTRNELLALGNMIYTMREMGADL